jgi:hypothetical protein
MTIHASHRPRLVRAAPPEHLIALRVAGQASGILFLYRGGRILGKPDGDRFLAAPGIDVGFPWPVTSFAAPCIQWRFGMRHRIAHDGVDEGLVLFGVAGYANFRANIIAIRLGRR